MQVNFFPLTLVLNNDEFKHLRHLVKIEKYWSSDFGMPFPNEFMIRVVFDEDAVTKSLSEAKDCSFEVDILIEVLEQLNNIANDTQFDEILENLDKTKSGKPRFSVAAMEKPASFPEFINPMEPKQVHFKKAKKRIAELAKQLMVIEGEYDFDEAKKIINALRDIIVTEINFEIAKYDFSDAIPFLLARVDALNANYERDRYMAQHKLGHDIDYQPEVMYAEHNTKFIQQHKNYRYLIEKFVQLEPNGNEMFGREQFQYLIALIDWLHVFYSASDHLHYGIMPVGMKLDREFLVEILYEEGIEEKEKAFAEAVAQLDLGLIGNPEDRVVPPRPLEKYLEELDQAATKDLGFCFRQMLEVLHMLSLWPVFRRDIDESTSYSAELNEIEKVSSDALGIESSKLMRIIDFFTLKKNDVIRVLGQDEPCSDLPVWEYRKRYSRYNLKPLILIGGKYHWGPYSVRKTGIVWSGSASTGMLPADLQSPSIDKILKKEKNLIEKSLVNKTFDIIKRHTPHVSKNLKLHNLKPKSAHPADLGDYDILSFYPQKNIVFNIECKDILPAHCLKDAKRLREKIFGRPGLDEGQFAQINKRRVYLSENIFDIAAPLGWPINTSNPPEIITVYLSRTSYWWTNFPPAGIDAVFLRVDMLSDFIEKLEN